MLTYKTFEERFEYLKVYGTVGSETFGYDRFLNQKLYNSKEWRNFRNKIIERDNGHDLAINDDEHKIYEYAYIHHINPITVEDILNRDPKVFDPNNVVCTTRETHNALHYGSLDSLPKTLIERKPNDTCPWR